MRFDDDQIIAFLLGDVVDDVATEILQELARNPQFVARVDEFRRLLGLLEDSKQDVEPPPGLVERTMLRITEESVEPSIEIPSIEIPSIDSQSLVNDTNASTGSVMPASRLPVDGDSTGRVRLRNRWTSSESAPRPPRGVWDSTALTLSLSILCCLALPALVRIRFESRKAQCASNIRETGQAMGLYALSNAERRFPEIDPTGPTSFAGLYALRLNDAQLLRSIEQLLCPSLSQRFCDAAEFDVASQKPTSLGELPSVSQLMMLDSQALKAIQWTVGGDFAYTLGVIEDDELNAPQCGQSHLAILADAPVFYDGKESFVAHDGQGMNILYADGRVQFICVPEQWSNEATTKLEWPLDTDDPFRNEAGEHRAGLHLNDASIAPSRVSPSGL